jgi:hypothetical protein
MILCFAPRQEAANIVICQSHRKHIERDALSQLQPYLKQTEQDLAV